ncbi:GNAT family N-acetyltransferase [Acidisoma cellulosilytica]|uniref:GNAT family N-acetyltransferase n=1 Tax=Acidisoma cellulosilyticum TaxID=2802395 RepID=A0A964E2Y7_9PROT|nr:GNAT family N-acetyltransferase [Acidisoma cellulosilyticum]MCB8879722.1 GNAT family N-acetyltransferase [Acidisoma cellulosilyticum]
MTDILTPRLRLTVPTIDHFAQCLALWSDPAVTRFIGGVPQTREQIWARLLRYIGHWQALGFGYWVVETIEGGRFVGEVGFSDYRRDITPRFDGTPEMGWVLSPAAHGQGFATEATKAALTWRDSTLPGRETVAIIQPDHAASLRVAAKLGFVVEQTAIYHDDPILLLRRQRHPLHE